ncbi:hypothetical protein CXB51_014375 [Gossypium anomalum]|uniref:RNase H type-1 domain-containing protein n=1 Tax=Gossypium anomalum TaxID=47600 RepID=A0A8J5Z447_9ROSI|nr:hypothetical protein CXB51_014375 [Gossypium anomalum]
MTVVVTLLSGSEKLRLHRVFASLQDSGSLLGYIRTYGIDSRSVSKLGSFVMENGLLDRVEGNADVHRWSEQTQQEKGDSIIMGYVSELSDYTRISVTQSNLQELKEIWDQWGNEIKQLFYDNYGDLPYLLDIQTWYLPWKSTLPYFVVPGMSEQWITARIKEKGECKALGYVDEATTDLFHRLSKRVTSVPNYSPLKDIAASSGKVDVPEENWIALLQNLQSGDVEWRAPWMVPGEILYRCGNFDWGAIGYAPLLVLRQHGLRKFVPATHGLAQSEFVYRGADYKRKVSKVSSTWNKTCRLKGVAISPATTPEYVEWRSGRINDNVPMTKMEEAQPMEEYLQVIPSELDIIKQEFKRKNLELEKKTEKLEEEKMYLSLDVDLQKKEVEKVRKEKRKVEEDRDDLKEEYKKAQNLALEKENKGLKTKVTKLGRSLRWHRNHDPTVELEELKSKVKDLEVALHDGELRIEQLEAQRDCIKGKLHQVKGQVMDRDYISQKAIKGSVVADFLASRALEDYEPLNFGFPNKELMCIATTEDSPWRLNFDGASNAVGNGIGAVLVSPNGDHYPLTCKLDFDCTNNMAEYEACIMGLQAAIERGIKTLEVYGDSALVIYQLRGEWETRDPKLINYRKVVLGLLEEFDDITFNYLPRDEN